MGFQVIDEIIHLEIASDVSLRELAVLEDSGQEIDDLAAFIVPKCHRGVLVIIGSWDSKALMVNSEASLQLLTRLLQSSAKECCQVSLIIGVASESPLERAPELSSYYRQPYFKAVFEALFDHAKKKEVIVTRKFFAFNPTSIVETLLIKRDDANIYDASRLVSVKLPALDFVRGHRSMKTPFNSPCHSRNASPVPGARYQIPCETPGPPVPTMRKVVRKTCSSLTAIQNSSLSAVATSMVRQGEAENSRQLLIPSRK